MSAMSGRAGRLLPLAGAVALLLALYLPSVSPFVGRGDVAKFQLVGPALGTAHPTGYPLYTLLAHAPRSEMTRSASSAGESRIEPGSRMWSSPQSSPTAATNIATPRNAWL